MSATTPLSIPCVILSGGKSSRMGEDKALLPFGDFPSLAQFQYHRLSRLFSRVYLSCKESTRFPFPAHFIEDKSDIFAPSIAIESAFEALESPWIFFITVDSPLVSEESIRAILSAPQESHHAILAQTPLKKHYLIGLYHRGILPRLRALLEASNYRLRDLAETPETLFIPFENEAEFSNLNTPQDYQSALLRVKQKIQES